MAHNRDLFIGLFTLFVAASAFYWLGGRLVERFSKVVANSAAIVALCGTFLFSLLFWGRLDFAKTLPLTNVILISNWIPLGAALLMGNVMAQPALPSWRRIAIASILGVLAWYTVVRDLSGLSGLDHDLVFQDGLPLQMGSGSCSACSAAILLRHHGIQATEREMTALCLTRTDGTPELGLYRGLVIKTRGTPWEVQIVHIERDDVARTDFEPMLALIHLNRTPGTHLSLLEKLQGPSHAIVLYGLSDAGLLVVADPVSGLARWRSEQFAANWPVKGIRLVRRQPLQNNDKS